MEEVKIADLKAHLSHYLRLVQNGEEVLVKDRERPVARLVAFSPGRPRLQTIPARLTRDEARKLLATIPRPKLSRRVIDDTVKWMKQDRAARWFPKKHK